MPIVYYTRHVVHNISSDNVKFVVIGRLHGDRGDYDGVLDAFEELVKSGTRDMTLSLLGAPSERRRMRKEGMRIISRCRILQSKGCDIRFFTKFLPENLMSHEIESADVIIAPWRSGFYGRAFSGAVIRAIQFAKPLICPKEESFYYGLDSCCLFYNKIEELPVLIKNILHNHGILSELSKNAIENSEKFSLELVVNRFREGILENILD